MGVGISVTRADWIALHSLWVTHELHGDYILLDSQLYVAMETATSVSYRTNNYYRYTALNIVGNTYPSSSRRNHAVKTLKCGLAIHHL
jgi:hypothetical protein